MSVLDSFKNIRNNVLVIANRDSGRGIDFKFSNVALPTRVLIALKTKTSGELR